MWADQAGTANVNSPAGRGVVLIHEPLFSNVRSAVRFGLLFAGRPSGSSLWRDWMAGSEGRRHSLIGSSVDAAGQAGIIATALRYDLVPAHIAALTARVTPPKTSCECGNPCCCGFRPNNEWEGAVTTIATTVQAALGTGLRQELARRLVSKIYERGGSLPRLSKRFGQPTHVLETYAESFRRYVEGDRSSSGLEADAWMAAGDSMRRIGIVPEDA